MSVDRVTVLMLAAGCAAAAGLASSVRGGTPANNACSSAQDVGVGTWAGSTIDATTDGAATCGVSNTAPDVWFRHSASADGQLVVSTCGGATWDTVLSIHTACPGTEANELVCNDDVCATQSRVSIPVMSGQEVLIRVAGWEGAFGTFLISITLQPPPAAGADAFLGELTQVEQFGRVGSIIGCGVDSPLCNAGSQPLDWFGNPYLRHPFMVSNMYRLSSDGSRLRQIGMSWVKHGFGAAQFDACSLGCSPYPDPTRLGVGCSDTYDAFTNANTAFLGPRHEINPWTGSYTFPGSHLDGDPGDHDAIEHRLQIHDADLDAANWPGATYIVEEYIVTHDDADHMNSIAREPVLVTGAAHGEWSFDVGGGNTQIGPAILAWPAATLTTIPPDPAEDEADDGRAILGAKATDNGDGTWHYEYALYNHDMERGVQSLHIPADAATAISGVGFAAVLSHDEPYSNAAWISSRDASGITWQTQPYNVNPFSNPLRWGTMYNFWFDADVPPDDSIATLALFKPGPPGAPASLTGPTAGPALPPIPGDLDGDGDVDVADLLDLLAAWGPCPNCPATPCAADLNGNCAVSVSDLLILLANWT